MVGALSIFNFYPFRDLYVCVTTRESQGHNVET